MRQNNLVVQLFGVAFLCLSVALTGSASHKEELERAAELAVERAAERVAERAVEKALESGNSTSETETIRVSHSNVRKYDSTKQLPSFVYTPKTRREYKRIAKEKNTGKLAVAEIIRGRLFKRAIIDGNYNHRDSQVRQENDNIFSNEAALQREQTKVNQHDTPMKLLHPETVLEVNQFYPLISFRNIPLGLPTSSHDNTREVHHYSVPVHTVLYHPIKLLRISQAIPPVYHYHRPSPSQSIHPIYLYPKVEMAKNANDQTKTY